MTVEWQARVVQLTNGRWSPRLDIAGGMPDPFHRPSYRFRRRAERVARREAQRANGDGVVREVVLR